MEQIHRFELERSTDGVNWTMLNAAIAPSAQSYDDAETPAVGSSFYYRLTGKTIPSNMDIPYNIVSLTNEGANPGTCLLQRHWGGVNSFDGCNVRKIRVAANGDVIVCGDIVTGVNANDGVNFGGGLVRTIVPNGGTDAWVAKYSADGTFQWVVRWGHASADNCADCCLDSAGNIICTGHVSASVFPGMLDFGFGPVLCSTGSEVFVLKLNPQGGLIYFKVFGGTGADVGLRVAVDNSDNIYLTGTYGFFGTGIDFGGGPLPLFGGQGSLAMYVAKLTPAGVYDWAVGYGGNDGTFPTGMAVHSSGIYISGRFLGTTNLGTGDITSAGGIDGFLAKYSLADGSPLWVKPFLGSEQIALDQVCQSVDVDSSGNAVVIGQFQRTMIVPGGPTLIRNASGVVNTLFAAKYTAAGGFEWVSFWDVQYNAAIPTGVAIDSLGYATFCGEMITGIDFGFGFLLGQGGNDLMLVKLNPQGQPVWARRGAPFGNGGMAIAVHPTTRQLLVCGHCSNQIQNRADFGALQVITVPGTNNNSWWSRWQP